MNSAYSPVVETARQYYNSDDADNFCFHVWGGEDIHIGLYALQGESIATARRRTVDVMSESSPFSTAEKTHSCTRCSSFAMLTARFAALCT